MKALLLSLLLIPGICFAADVFKWTDEKGNIHFGDQPTGKAAESVELKKPTVYSAPDFPGPQLRQNAGSDEALQSVDVTHYSLSITSPAAEQTFRDAEGKIPVMARVTPNPDKKQALIYRFSLDGKAVSEGSQSGIQLTGVERGSHQVSVSLIDQQGKVLASSQAVTFFLHKTIAKPKKKPKKKP